MSSRSEGRILTFRSVHEALAADGFLRDKGLSPRLIPVPVGISSDCGFCLLVSEDESGELRKLLEVSPEEGSGQARGLNDKGKTPSPQGIWRVLATEDGNRKVRSYERET